MDFLTRPVAYHSALARLLNSVPAAVMLSQAIYWQQRVPEYRPRGCPGVEWWYHTIEEWESETALKRHDQLTARKILKKAGFWFEEKKGIPAKLWFWVDFFELEKTLQNSQFAVTRQTRLPQRGRLDGRFRAGRFTVMRQTLQAENTTENTITNHSLRFEDNGNKKQVQVVELSSTTQSLSTKQQDHDQEDYLRMMALYGNVRSLAALTVTKRRSWRDGDGMTEVDITQLAEWRVQKQRELAAKKAKADRQYALEQQDQQHTAQAAVHEEKVLARMSEDLRQAIISAKSCC